MGGAISLVRSMFPTVRLITTFSGSKQDTVYLANTDGTAWRAQRAGVKRFTGEWTPVIPPTQEPLRRKIWPHELEGHV